MAKAAAKEVKENQFEEYKEQSVVETKTTFPADLAVAADKRSQIRAALHANPKDAAKLEYIRCPTGFVRHITVSAADVARLGDLGSIPAVAPVTAPE